MPYKVYMSKNCQHCKPDDGLGVGQNMFHYHPANKQVVFWSTLSFTSLLHTQQGCLNLRSFEKIQVWLKSDKNDRCFTWIPT